jgi:hypothetical protein
MLSKLAQIALALTSLAPISIVYGGTFLSSAPVTAAKYIALAFGLGLVCHALLRVARTSSTEPFQIESVENADKDVFAFLITYGLPVLTPISSVNPTATLTFICVAFIVLYNANLVHVNPLMSAFRYRFYQVDAQNGVTYLLITRRRTPVVPGRIQARQLATHIWIEST